MIVDGLLMDVFRLLIRSSKSRWPFFLGGLSREEPDIVKIGWYLNNIFMLLGTDMPWSTSMILTPSSNLNRIEGMRVIKLKLNL